MAYSHSFPALLVLGVLGFASANAQDAADLAGIRPGETLRAVAENHAVAQSPAPFVWFGVPTRLPALAQIFPDGNLHVLRDGTIVGVRWQRAYSTLKRAPRSRTQFVSCFVPTPPATLRVTIHGGISINRPMVRKASEFHVASTRVAITM